jgi:hypothetical protein
VSPQIVLYAAKALKKWDELQSYLINREKNAVAEELERLEIFAHKNPGTPSFETALRAEIDDDARSKMHSLLLTFRAYFSRQVDRQMARKHIELDPDFDCASLAFALRGLALLDDGVRATTFFQTCVKAVVEGQNPDGCWPEGITVSYHETGDVGPVRQPSVEIALALAENVFHRSSLFRCEPHDVELLTLAIPALKRQLRFLAASFQELGAGYAGWADDRLRAPGEVRMQVNAMAASLINNIRLAEIAFERAKILDRYKPEWPSTEPWRGDHRPEDDWAKVFDPDEITKPCEFLRDQIIRPIAEQMRAGHFFLRPPKNGVSFILYGPPGSGKTFVVSKFAAALGWPLIQLNPGHFIEKGLESIEAVAGEIFANLRNLDHAVVFFDECDELFRDRSKTEEGARNILSFATASMLPKLQKLHDAQKVLFVLGTNYVRNIDLAIRRPGRFDAILLFDRPDRAARLAIGKSIFARKRNLAPDKLPRRDVAKAEEIADASAGWMIEQVMSRTKSHLQGTDYPAPSVSDYSDWCTMDGRDEIVAAGIDPAGATYKAILDRWKPFIKL